MKERLKQIRKTLNLTQQEFANKINLSRSAYANVESGVTNLTERNIGLICKELNINENWLRNGEGEMFSDLNSDEEFNYLVGIFSASNDEYKKRIIKAMLKIQNKEDWELITTFVFPVLSPWLLPP